jgi:hypothetical protein
MMAKRFRRKRKSSLHLDVDLDVLQLNAHELGVDLENAVAGSDELKLEEKRREREVQGPML